MRQDPRITMPVRTISKRYKRFMTAVRNASACNLPIPGDVRRAARFECIDLISDIVISIGFICSEDFRALNVESYLDCIHAVHRSALRARSLVSQRVNRCASPPPCRRTQLVGSRASCASRSLFPLETVSASFSGDIISEIIFGARLFSIPLERV